LTDDDKSFVSATEYTAFDIIGRVTGSKQVTDGVSYETGYVYNLAGAVVEETYPSGRKVKNTLDASGDLSMVQSGKCLDAAFGTNGTCINGAGLWSYARHFSYNAAGAVTGLQLGNGRWESTQFNSRLQPTQIALGATQGATNLLKLDYSYGTTNNNGNVLSQTITVPTVGESSGFVAVQTYDYDSLNRLKQAAEMVAPTGGSPTLSWKQTFVFDRYGNRSFDEGLTTTLPRDCVEAGNPVVCESVRPVVNPSVNPLNNRFSTGQGWSYDAAGNVTADPQGRQFTYDAENKQVKVESVDANGNPVNTIGVYEYDGDGKRVKKIVPATSEVTVFVYDAGGKLVAEYSTIVQPIQDAKVAYLTADHLGSPRINTDANGNVTARHDYHPFGEEVGTLAAVPGSPQPRTATLGYTTDTIRRQFTSYERDDETELDFAQSRMHNYNHGRFTSPDPLMASADIVNPQTFNRYAYVGNNPTNFTDPTGEIWGQLDGTVRWFDDEKAMKNAGFSAYNLLYAYRTGTNQMVALNAVTGAAVNVASAAEWLAQEAAWGETAASLGASASALLGVPVAVATMVVADILDPEGRYRTGQDLPEPVREFSGTQTKFWEDYMNAMSRLKESNPSASSSPGESTPADPNSVKPDPDDNKPTKSKASNPTQSTPKTDPGRFEPVRGQPAKRDKETGEIWVLDRLHRNHYEVYKNRRDYERGRRSRSVWADGRLKQTF